MKKYVWYFWLGSIYLGGSAAMSATYKVVCTTTILYDLTKNIAPDDVQVICLMPVGGDPHIYEPTPGDATKVAEADMIVRNGLYLEGWLNELIENSMSKSIEIVDATAGIQPIQNQQLHSSPDPHAWMDPVYAKIYVQNISEALQRLVPHRSKVVVSKTQSYLGKLDSLHAYIQKRLELIPEESRILITSHDAFRYYGQRYHIRVESVMGTSTDADVQISDLKRLGDVIRKYNIKALFVESTINPKLLSQLAADRGIQIGGKLYSDSLGDEFSQASTYLAMLGHNTEILVTGLSGKNSNSLVPIEVVWILLVVGLLLAMVFIIAVRYLHPTKFLKKDWSHYSIEVKNLSVSYEKKTVLLNINLQLESGHLYGLLGPNGAGKSTLFKTMLGFVKPDQGYIHINGCRVDQVRNKIAYIPQKEDIDWTFPVTVLDIVLTGRLPHKNTFTRYSDFDRKIAYEAMGRLGILDYKNRQIGDLSGGQQQRVFIARALCQQAELLLFDEPFVGVDVTSESKIIALIKSLVAENKTVIIIHHDLSKVMDYFDNVIMVNQTLMAFGKTVDVFTLENIEKTFKGQSSILEETDKAEHENSY